MTRGYHLLGVVIFGFIVLATSRSAHGQVALPWTDDFESYADATVLDGINGWQGFSDNPTFAASSTTSPPAPLPNSAVGIGGTNDAVVRFTPPTSGKWAVEFRQYIPSGLTGTSYLIMLNQYDDACSSCNWSLQVQFNGTSGMMIDDGSLASQAYIADAWVDIRIEINLDTDTQRFLYNGVQFYTGTWSGHVSGGGSTEIEALNLYANGATAVYYDDFSVTEILAPSLPWSDDFESYADATVLNGLNGWQGFSDNPTFAASTTTSPPAPLPNSAVVIEGANDAVVPFTPPTSGKWAVEFRQYIPSGLTGTSYLIMLNQYDDVCSSCNWSLQMQFDGATDMMIDDGSLASQAYIADQWVDIRIEIDLDTDTQRFLYNGVQFYTGTWSGHVSGGGITEIGALNLYANGATAVYYDDFSITEILAPSLPWSDDFESYADATVLNGLNGWQGFSDNPTFAASTTTSPPAPLPNSAVVIGGANDAIVPFTPPTSGLWLVQFRQFIPSDFSGVSYFIMLNQYDDVCSSCNWSIQVQFNGTTGMMTDDGSLASQAYVADQWVDVAIEIDLDSDTQEFFYNGISFYTGTWSGHVSGGGITEIGALNLYANGATEVYYDDFSLTETGLPVELTSFEALIDEMEVVLTWSTASETNNAGFSVEHELEEGRFVEIGYVDGHGTTEEPQQYRFEVTDLGPGVHRFRLKQIDFDGAFGYSSVAEAILTVPDRFWVEAPYPNPFNGSATLRFAVPVDQQVDVALYSVTGQLVRVLHSGIAPANETRRLTIDADGLASGTYFVRFVGNGISAAKRVVVAR